MRTLPTRGEILDYASQNSDLLRKISFSHETFDDTRNHFAKEFEAKFGYPLYLAPQQKDLSEDALNYLNNIALPLTQKYQQDFELSRDKLLKQALTKSLMTYFSSGDFQVFSALRDDIRNQSDTLGRVVNYGPVSAHDIPAPYTSEAECKTAWHQLFTQYEALMRLEEAMSILLQVEKDEG